MSEMVERVGAAIYAIKLPSWRLNKARADGTPYEVIVDDVNQPIDESNPKEVGAYRTADEAIAAVRTLSVRMRGRAVIEAMREPTEAMVQAAHEEAPHIGSVFWWHSWRAMIDAALKD